MKSLLAFFTVLLFATAINARKSPGDYWKDAMKDQPMPEALQGLLASNPNFSYKQKADCHTSLQTQDSKQGFDPTPNLSIYHNDAETNEEKTFMKDEARDEIINVKDFEASPSATMYHG